MGERNAHGPLTGIRVLDLSSVVSGPFCTQVLGDLGAEVVKIETPRGDSTRMMGPPFKGGLTPIFAHFNRNKRSLVLDLKQPEGLEVARRFAAGADVLVENWRPGVAARLGLGYEELVADNPRLVYVSINGFGSQGPYRDFPAYDNVIQGLVGFTHIQGDAHEPRLVRCIAADKTTGMTAVYGTLAALLARERNGGRGQRVEVPMLDSYAAFMLPDVFGSATFVPAEPGPSFDLASVHRPWETADGHVVMMVVEDDQFQGICRALERADLIDDPRCANLMTRIAHGAELFALLEEELKKWNTKEIVERARRFGAPLAPANDLEGFLEDPQVRASEVVFEVEDPQSGTMRMLRNPVRFAATPSSVRSGPPRLGEQSDELLREAGYPDDEIAKLRECKAVR